MSYGGLNNKSINKILQSFDLRFFFMCAHTHFELFEFQAHSFSYASGYKVNACDYCTNFVIWFIPFILRRQGCKFFNIQTCVIEINQNLCKSSTRTWFVCRCVLRLHKMNSAKLCQINIQCLYLPLKRQSTLCGGFKTPLDIRIWSNSFSANFIWNISLRAILWAEL